MSAHLINTLLLLSALLLTVWWGSGGERLKLKGQGAIGWALGIGLAAAMLLSVSGAVTALGDTLYPAHSLIQGFQQDISPTAHFLIRLRFLHPLLAMSIGLYLLLIAGLVSYLRPSEAVCKYAKLTGSAIVVQIAAGFLNLGLLAPVWMQLVHLLLADLLWISLLLMSFAALAEGTPRVELGERNSEEDVSGIHEGAGTASFRDYLELTKPRVISLLLFTTLAAMIIADGGWPGMVLFFSVAVGGYMAAGAANAINMVLDRDIDARMKRTSHRPTVTRTISSRNALIFAFTLELGSFLILTVMANLLSAMLALAGLVFYVLVYTLGLKRRTWHNIVIGGAAGAFPPLVGWAAATGQLNALAWWLFAVIFLWTPVHFWALAIMIKDDYALAGIPMLPVVRSERMTVAQIALYAVLTALISILPLAQGKVGYIYLVISFFLNAALLVRAAQLYIQPGRPRALSLYKYSMLYLALLFLTVAVDRVFR
jgi:protoheme IX farnesyltransferase